MTEQYASAEELRPLYAVMAQIKDLKPWEWMEETDIFGVQDPLTKAVDFVSVMGGAGEHYAISLYLGAEGLAKFLDFQANQSRLSDQQAAEMILQMPQLMASFEDRDVLNDGDRAVIKSLGLKFRGAKAWPLFRSYRAGYLPWWLEEWEAQRLCTALGQVLEVAPRFRADSKLLRPSGRQRYLVRIPSVQNGNTTWSDSARQIEAPAGQQIPLVMNTQLLAACKKLPHAKFTLELDFSMLEGAFRERKERPHFGYHLLIAETSSQMILGTDIMAADPTLEAMYGQLPLKVVQAIAQLRSIPAEIRVASPLLAQLCQLVAKELGFKVKEVKRLSVIESIQREMAQMMGGRI